MPQYDLQTYSALGRCSEKGRLETLHHDKKIEASYMDQSVGDRTSAQCNAWGLTFLVSTC